MKFAELKLEEIKVGIKMKSMADPNVIGTITKLEPIDKWNVGAYVEWTNGNISLIEYEYEDSVQCELL